MSKYSIEISNISKNYGNICALDNVSINISKGEVVALLGPNGAGKSTLMNILATFLSPTCGSVLVNGFNADGDDILVKKDIGFLPEGGPLYGDMSVEMFLKYIIELKLNIEDIKEDRKEIKKRYKDELKRVMDLARIEHVAKQKIETLSKGYNRRVGFAMSLIGNPSVLLLDEPTDGLDPNQKEHFKDLIKKMKKDKTIVISTHLLEEADSIASRIIIMNKGKIVISGKKEEILSKTKTKNLEDAFKTLTKQQG